MNSIRNSLLFVCLVSPFVAISQTPTKQILDLKVDSFHTGLEEVGNSFWVDDNQFVMTTLKEGAERNVNDEETPTRIALVNFSTKTIKYIAQDVRLLDFTFDHKTRSIFIGNLHTSDPVDADGRRHYVYTYTNLREIRVEPDGRVAEIKRYPPGSAPPPAMAAPKGLHRALDGGRGGYLVRALAPGETYADQWEKLVKDDEGYPTVWKRDGKPDMKVPVRFDEVDSGEYVAFLDKYQLNDYDTALSSSTSSRIAVTVWKRPYEYTPFRLLAQDGSVQEIPYPEFVFDYGIAERGKRGANFGRLIVAKPGILIQKKRVSGSALYLYRNEQLYVVAGGNTTARAGLAENSAEGVQATKLSPDGCKLAYSHFKHLASMSEYRAPHFFNIINLCIEQK
jgi:hypothetical protein